MQVLSDKIHEYAACGEIVQLVVLQLSRGSRLATSDASLADGGHAYLDGHIHKFLLNT